MPEMPMHLRQFVFYIFIGFLGAMHMDGEAAQAKVRPAVQLVELMQLRKGILIGAAAPYLKYAPSASDAEKFLACVENSNGRVIDDKIAARVVEQLTANEIENSIAFYESGAGKKYTSRDMSIVKASALQSQPSVIRFSKHELDAIERFTKSTAGRKLIVEQVIFADQLVDELMPLIQEVHTKCGGRSNTKPQ